MKLIIAGGRDYTLTERDYTGLLRIKGVTEVVCGMARGADTGGKMWALRKGIPVTDFPADWRTFGKKAGHIRNIEMAMYADAVVLFPGGAGTTNMYQTAVKYKLKILDWRTGAP